MQHQEFRVNKQTGEIEGQYTVTDYKPMSIEDARYYKYTASSPHDATNLDQLLDFIKVRVDKRKLVTYNGTKALHDASCGMSVRSGSGAMFTLPQYKTMNKLIKALVYRNIIIATKADLAKKLGVDVKKLKQTLAVVSNLVDVVEEGMSKGYIKIFIHPAYGFKYESSTINSARSSAELKWVKAHTVVGDFNESHFQTKEIDWNQMDAWLSVFSKGIKKKNDNFKRDKEGNIILPDFV